MGSDSDLTIMKAAGDMLQEFSIPFELTVVSAHRTPHRMVEYATRAAAPVMSSQKFLVRLPAEVNEPAGRATQSTSAHIDSRKIAR